MQPDFLGALAIDRAQQITSCDDSFVALFGKNVKDMYLDELLSPRDRRGAHEFSSKLVKGDRIDQLLTLRFDGNDVLARVRMVPRDDGYALFAERVQSDLVYKLTVVQERWKGMLRSSTDGVAMLDGKGIVVEHNPVFFWLMGFRDARGVTLSEAAVVGRSLADLAGARSKELTKYLEDGKGGDFVTRFGDLELVATPIELPSRERVGTFVLVRDIREQAQIEARDAIIARDLAQARAFQQMILAKPPAVAGHVVDVAYRPVAQVGGDIYDARMVGDALRLFVADATGHGVTAALVTMLIKSSYDAVAASPSPGELLAKLNDRVAESSKGLEAMFTAAVVDVDLKAGTITHASAAHLPPIVVANGMIMELASGGTFMGVSPGRVYPSWTQPFPAGASVFLVTDGLAEARRADGEQFGDDRLRRALLEASGLPDVANAVLARLDAWLKPGKPDDDIAILGLRPQA